MKKGAIRAGSLLLTAALTAGLISCQKSAGFGKIEGKDTQAGAQEKSQSPETDIIVFAAASMAETLEEIGRKYEEEHPGLHITYTFDSSGTLKSQIAGGADCDLFISASQFHMNALDKTAEENPDKLDLIDPDTRVDLLENEVTVAVREDSELQLNSFADLAKDEVTSLGLGNEDVPVGRYALEILKSMGIDNQVAPKANFGSNVKEVTTWIKEGAVDCGIIYKTDAYSAGLKVLLTAGPDELKTPVIYPAAVLKGAHHEEEAEAFLQYLQEPESSAVFSSVGFKPLSH